MSYLRYHAMLLMTLAVSAGAAGPGGERVPADELVAEALAHSPLLKASRADASAAAARGDQADALRWPEVAVDARAARYEGLEDSVFGPAQVIPAIEDRYAAGITVTERLFTGGRVSGERRAAGFRQQGAELDAGAAEADLILRVLQAYWRWSKAGSSVVAFEASVERMKRWRTRQCS